MTTLTFDDPLVKALRLEEVQSYLSATGWQARQQPNPKLLVYQGDLDDQRKPIEVVLTSNSAQDTYRRIAEVLTTLAALEDRTAQEVAEDVASVNDDVVLWRLHDPNGQQSISVETAASFIGGLGHLLTYSACLEETPRPYFPRATAIGREFMQHCRFGHTRPGSFIFEMESPLSFESARSVIRSNKTPFSRRVIQRLVHGLTEVRQATDSGDSAPLVQSYRDGLNANAYETLSSMLEGTSDGGFEFDYKWSPLLSTSSARKRPGFVRLDMKAVDYLKDAAGKLRQMKPVAETRLRGRILRLGADTDGTLRVITLDTSVEGRPRHVRIALEPGDYSLACDAHRDNRPILVTGTLEKLGRTWRLVDPQDFSLV